MDVAGALGPVQLYKVVLQRLTVVAVAAGIFWGASRLLSL